MAKQQYRVRNWNEYNKALKDRGSITSVSSASACDRRLIKIPVGMETVDPAYTRLYHALPAIPAVKNSFQCE